jgi:hypothetical protein
MCIVGATFWGVVLNELSPYIRAYMRNTPGQHSGVHSPIYSTYTAYHTCTGINMYTHTSGVPPGGLYILHIAHANLYVLTWLYTQVE